MFCHICKSTFECKKVCNKDVTDNTCMCPKCHIANKYSVACLKKCYGADESKFILTVEEL